MIYVTIGVAALDMWRQEHAEVQLVSVPGDMVMSSGSGLDPHITLENAQCQLDRVAGKWAANTGWSLPRRYAPAIEVDARATLSTRAGWSAYE